MINVLQANHLRDIGERTLDEFLRRTMIKLMTNNVALQYNMHDKIIKKSFPIQFCVTFSMLSYDSEMLQGSWSFYDKIIFKIKSMLFQ